MIFSRWPISPIRSRVTMGPAGMVGNGGLRCWPGLLGLAFELLQARLPQRGEAGQPVRIDMAEGNWIERVVPFAPSFQGPHEPCLPEHAEMFGDGRPAHVRELSGDLAGGQALPLAEQVQNGAPGRVGDGRESVVTRWHADGAPLAASCPSRPRTPGGSRWPLARAARSRGGTTRPGSPLSS